MERSFTTLWHFVFAWMLCVTLSACTATKTINDTLLHDAGRLVYRRWAPESRPEGERVRGTQFRESQTGYGSRPWRIPHLPERLVRGFAGSPRSVLRLCAVPLPIREHKRERALGPCRIIGARPALTQHLSAVAVRTAWAGSSRRFPPRHPPVHLRASVSRFGSAISPRTAMNNAGCPDWPIRFTQSARAVCPQLPTLARTIHKYQLCRPILSPNRTNSMAPGAFFSSTFVLISRPLCSLPAPNLKTRFRNLVTQFSAAPLFYFSPCSTALRNFENVDWFSSFPQAYQLSKFSLAHEPQPLEPLSHKFLVSRSMSSALGLAPIEKVFGSLQSLRHENGTESSLIVPSKSSTGLMMLATTTSDCFSTRINTVLSRYTAQETPISRWLLLPEDYQKLEKWDVYQLLKYSNPVEYPFTIDGMPHNLFHMKTCIFIAAYPSTSEEHISGLMNLTHLNGLYDSIRLRVNLLAICRNNNFFL